MPVAEEALTLGLQYQRAGQFYEAEQVYLQVLETDSANADALSSLAGVYLALNRLAEARSAFQQMLRLRPKGAELHNDLGVVIAQQGKPIEATACFRQALELRPDYAEASNNLGIVLAQQGKLREAVLAYQQALRIRPDYAEAHSNLGLVLGSLGKLPEAIASHSQALDIKPDFIAAQNNLEAALAAQQQLAWELAGFRMNQWYLSDEAVAYNELGLALKAQGRWTEAITSFQEALRIRADFPEAYNNLGVTFKDRGNLAEADESLRQALELKTDFMEANNNLGTVLESVGKLEEASACYEQALRCKPDFAEAHNNLGVVLNKQSHYAEAMAHYQEALKLKPDYADAHHNVGTLLVDQGKLEEGLASYDRAIQLNPDDAEAHLGRAQAWLQLGDFERGFPEFEWRWRRSVFPPRPFPQPVWDGSSLAGRTILLHAEQGFGDTLQFIRYAPLVKQRGGWVIVECQETLAPLLATCPGIDQLIVHGSPLPYFHTHAPLVSLPRILQTTLESIPAEVPYVSADPELIEHWRKAVDPTAGFRIGIAWQGNPGHTNDRNRSVRLAQFEPLAGLDGVRLFSLQKGPGTEQLTEVRERFSIEDLASQFQSFQDTAAALKNLDLVITVDSAVAHCAGALAVPVWVLLPFAADWRWFMDREDNPWYPSMRLFRQPEPGNWDSVFVRVVQDLSRQLAMPRSDREMKFRGCCSQTEFANEHREQEVTDTLALAVQSKEQGEVPRAEKLYRRILDKDPDNATARKHLAGICLSLGRFEEAAGNFQQLLRVLPNDAAIHNDRGIALAQLGKLSEAASCFQQALDVNPQYAEAHNNLGIVLAKQGRLEEALETYRQSVALKPDNPEAYYNLGNLFRDLGRLEEAQSNYREAIRLKPDHADAQTNLAMTWLLLGDFERGWPGYEWRSRTPGFACRDFIQPFWDGFSLAGATILLHAEQGLGDTLQFIRYAPLVKARGGFVIVECPATLLALLATCPGIDQLIAYGAPLPPFHTHAPLMSLPRLYGTTLATIPAEVPYLSVAPELQEYWRRQLSGIEGFKVGVFWQGDPRHRKDRQRSLPLPAFAPLANLDGVRLCSLQEGPGGDQSAAAPFPILNLASQFHDFADTASALMNLDLVISVDSAVAHCAGALGIPVWVLLPYAPDWRWLGHREDSPWYPSMRLFRQKHLGDWEEVFGRVQAALTELLREKRMSNCQ
jgi:tetratricopeptide (TPR) repeat protein